MGGEAVRPAFLAVARDPLLEASALTEIADVCRWNQGVPDEEAQLAGGSEAWAVQVRLLARSIYRSLGEEFGDPLTAEIAVPR